MSHQKKQKQTKTNKQEVRVLDFRITVYTPSYGTERLPFFAHLHFFSGYYHEMKTNDSHKTPHLLSFRQQQPETFLKLQDTALTPGASLLSAPVITALP